VKTSPGRLSSALVAIIIGASAALSLPGLAAASDWPQAHSDVPADPSVLFGTLPNGMRYAIMHNATPKNMVAMRLCVEAGSVDEDDAQQGLAHFLEHMAFRGSRHVPEDQVWPGLQRLGMGFGADANAQTRFTQTAYEFNLPRNDSQSIDAGLMRLRDIASELTLAQHAMNDERGVILSEERLRDTPDSRLSKLITSQALPGSIVASRFPIGKRDVIEHAPVSLIRQFYNAYYRPDRTTLIVVGDIDPKAMQAKIVSRFSDWKPVGPAGKEPPAPAFRPRGPQVDLFVDPGESAGIIMDWVTRATADTKARERTNLVQDIGLMILSYRLQALANGPERPFAQVQASIQRYVPAAYSHLLLLDTRPQDWRLALNAAVKGVRQILKYGVTKDEVKRAMSDVHMQLAQAPTRSSRGLANLLARAVDDNDVFEGPAAQLAEADATFKDLSVATVDKGLHDLMDGHGPLMILTSPKPIEGGEAAVKDALAAAEKAPLAAPSATAHVVWPYTHFGPTGKVVEKKTIKDLGTTFVRFANGVRLTVKPTTYTDGQVLVGVKIGDGRFGLPAHRVSAAWAFEQGGLIFGGLKAIGFNDMLRALSGHSYDVRTSLGDNGLYLWGPTRPADLSTELQVLTAYVSAPGWRPGALDRARSEEAGNIVEAAGSPEGVFQRDLPSLLRSGDQRWAWPTSAEVEALKPSDFESMLNAQLDATPIEVTVVGDTTVNRAIAAVAATFGALPPRTDPAAVPSAAVHFPAGTPRPIMLHHDGRADQGDAVIAWPTPDAFDLQTQADLQVLKNVFATRMNDQLRIRDGVTYSPHVSLNASEALPRYGYLLAETELPPAKMPLFFDVAQAIAADLRAHPISADELNRARKPKLEEVVAQMQTNAYWLGALIGAQSDPRLLKVIRATVPDLMRVTAADVQRAAQTYLVDAKAWKAEITPGSSAPHMDNVASRNPEPTHP